MREMRIIRIAKENGYRIDHRNRQRYLLRFISDNNNWMVDVWFTKMTVGTYLNHPRQGKTQLFRKNVSLELLDEIFKNPRIHTGKGYQTK